MKKMNKKGFTIVELSIVIAVVAILSAVLIPTFSGVAKNAKNSAALQEARNAYTQYLTECAEQKEDPATTSIIYAAENDRYVIITNGVVDKTVYVGKAALIEAVKGEDADVEAFEVVEGENGFCTIEDAE